MRQEWDAARHEREKRNFIETRRNLRPVYFHVALIFAATWLAGWGCSWMLLRLGLGSMAVRYAISFFLSYLVFIAAVRVWADVIRAERASGGWDGTGLDLPLVDAEGCLVVSAALALGLLAAGIFALVGGLPLLLEVAFEVAFAGVIVRRLSHKLTIGDWLGALVRKTWLHALVTLCVLVTVAAALQAKAPEARTFACAVQSLLASPSIKQEAFGKPP
ncbi:MAG TPA: hypothetical protein VIM34_17640 [Burkholderiaceae bacterium]